MLFLASIYAFGKKDNYSKTDVGMNSTDSDSKIAI